MSVDLITPEEQIDAVLSNALWSLKNRHFGNDWDAIPRLQALWTVSLEEVLAAAQARGLEGLVRDRPGGEGVFLLERQGGFEVRYMERAASIHGVYFNQLGPASSHWIRELMKSYGLLKADEC